MNRRNDNSSAAVVEDSGDLRSWLGDVLMALCAVDTTPRADLPALAKAEDGAFRLIEQHLAEMDVPGLRLHREAIDPGIAEHRFYSNPAYAATADRPMVPPATQVYRDRCNLLAMSDGTHREQPGLGINVHIDVVRPYIPPRREGRIVHGRGACDDKGPLASLLGAMRLLAQHLRSGGLRLDRKLTLMFVIDEESGGNGSLSLAIDRQLKQRYDALMVLECCSLNIHPGNRGAVWYQVRGTLPDANLFEASAYIVEEMEREGRAIKAESRHELFPHRPVQTCHGMLGGFGEHPSRICGQVDFLVEPAGGQALPERARQLLEDVLQAGLAEYIGLYGDKTKVTDETSGRPKLTRHYELVEEGAAIRVRVFGTTGHMGSILQNDGAITKAATLVRGLVASRAALDGAAGGSISVRLADWPDAGKLAMEGGQGFLPTHPMEQVQRRLQDAVWRGAARYLRLVGREADAAIVQRCFQVSFDKLHNAAFAGDPASPVMKDAMAAALQAKLPQADQPIRGWDVSCDSRIFACEYPRDLVVLTGGPGHLRYAHADDEQVELSEVADFAAFLFHFILRRCGVVAA